MSRRRQLQGAAAIELALSRGEPLRRIVLNRDAIAVEESPIEERARAAGVPVQRVAARAFERLRQAGGPADALALLGPAPDATHDDVLAGGEATWQLVGVAYPGNAGAALRTAEVSGAAGFFIAADFDHGARRAVLRASVRADRFLPVFFVDADTTLAAARRCGRRIVAIESTGRAAPWEADLTGRVHFVVGGEESGVPEPILALADTVVRLPMRGFVPSYNLQAAVAAVALERLRQLSLGAE